MATLPGYKKAFGWEEMPSSKGEEDAGVVLCRLSSDAKHNIKGCAGFFYFKIVGSQKHSADRFAGDKIKDSCLFCLVEFMCVNH